MLSCYASSSPPDKNGAEKVSRYMVWATVEPNAVSLHHLHRAVEKARFVDLCDDLAWDLRGGRLSAVEKKRELRFENLRAMEKDKYNKLQYKKL